MKQLLVTTLAFILLGTSAFGAEIKMECFDRKIKSGEIVDTFALKYADRVLMKDKACMRVNGRWIDLCDGLMQTLHNRLIAVVFLR